MQKSKAVRFVVCSQICLFGFLLVCTLLMPKFIFERDEVGVSNYGVHIRTIVPYTLAFGLGSVLMWLSARSLPSASASGLTLIRIMKLISALLFAVLLSTYPYQLNPTFDKLHIFFAILLFIAELAAGSWFVKLYRDIVNLSFLCLQLAGSLLALASLSGWLHILLIAQIITGLAFAALLIRTVAKAG